MGLPSFIESATICVMSTVPSSARYEIIEATYQNTYLPDRAYWRSELRLTINISEYLWQIKLGTTMNPKEHGELLVVFNSGRGDSEIEASILILLESLLGVIVGNHEKSLDIPVHLRALGTVRVRLYSLTDFYIMLSLLESNAL